MVVHCDGWSILVHSVLSCRQFIVVHSGVIYVGRSIFVSNTSYANQTVSTPKVVPKDETKIKWSFMSKF